jgi:regulator of sigma E protease
VSWVYAFLGFAALIVLHEAGHFVAAKAVGMRVERFSLFFGPMFIKKQVGDTEYGVGVIPLGGYVKITGMSPEEEFDSPEIAARAYYNQPVWKRIVVIAAGPAVNLVLAFAILWGYYGHTGTVVVTNTVGGVLQGSQAAKVLKPGDQLVSVDGVRGGDNALRVQIDTHRCAGKQVNGCLAATPATVVVRRDGQLRTFKIRPKYNAADRRPLLGFEFGTRDVGAPIGTAARYSGDELWSVTKSTVSAIGRIFESKERKQLHGIVGTYDVVQADFATNTSTAIGLLALVSLSLGVVNLFPFLPLDGGHIFWAVVEKLRGRRISLRVMERASFIGFALIAVLFVIGLSNDISSLTGSGLTPR